MKGVQSGKPRGSNSEVSGGEAEFSARERRGWADPGAIDPGIREEMAGLRVVDSHEHLETEKQRLSRPPDLKPFLFIYALSEMVSAGMPSRDYDQFNRDDLSAERQWGLARAWWPLVRSTPAGAAVRLSLRALYGIDDLRDSTIAPLMKAMAARAVPGFYRWALREKAGVECSLINLSVAVEGELSMKSDDPDLMLYDLSVAPLLADDLDIAQYEKAADISCTTIADWKAIIDRQFRKWGSRAVAIKNQCAYWRNLRFDLVSEAEAAEPFERWLLRKDPVSPAERKKVQDWTFHHCIKRAMEYNLPVKIHTGYHAWNNYSDPSWYQPKDLAGLFRRYPRAKFDVFHIGYPEHQDVVALAKHYANVWVDMCWAWLLDSSAAIRFVRQCVGALPANKLIGFGGDYPYPDNVYGHATMARDGLGLALTGLVREGRLTRADARMMARRWLRENAMELFRLDEKRGATRMEAK